jgi:hypothetical protein
VVEESFAQYQSEALQERLSSLLTYERDKCAFIIHSVPRGEIMGLVKELRYRGKYLFVTELCENYFTHFGATWADFIKLCRSARVESRGPWFSRSDMASAEIWLAALVQPDAPNWFVLYSSPLTSLVTPPLAVNQYMSFV